MTTQELIAFFINRRDSTGGQMTNLGKDMEGYNSAISLLQGDYASRLAEGDLKVVTDVVASLTTERDGLLQDKTTLIKRAELAESKVVDVKTLIDQPEVAITPNEVAVQIDEIITPAEDTPPTP